MTVQRNVAIKEEQDQMLIEMAARKQIKTGKFVSVSEIMREILEQHQSLSSVSIATLTQVAKDQGLDNLDEAIEYLARNGCQSSEG
jgi:Arc/MetJ-type ribon-helix-helix transcriptional regulator